MTLKQQIHKLVDELPDDSPLVVEVYETLQTNRALGEAMEDIRQNRVYAAGDFMARVERRWPRPSKG